MRTSPRDFELCALARMAWLTVFKISLNRADLTMRCKLGAKDHRRGSLIPQEYFFVAVVAALLLLFAPGRSAQSRVTYYNGTQLDALQSIFKAWNDTPDIETNLAGWTTKDPFPCARDNSFSNFRGVQCLTNILREPYNATKGYYNYSAFIIGLTLNDASIVGELPAAIGNIPTLSTLELTGNPNLTGQLPSQLQDTNLYILDVHDNNFYGNLPSFGNLTWLLKLNLSGNRFSGSFPTAQIESMTFLETLSLGSNQFEGEISQNIFENLYFFIHLNLSNNHFTSSVPTLNTNPNLQVLDLSRNNFSGALPDLTNISSLRFVNLSRNAFTGSFLLSSIFNNTLSDSLSMLDLSYNLLRGSLAKWNVSHLGSLKELLQGNPYCNNPRDYTDEQRCFCQQICLISSSVAKANRKVVIISSVASVLSALLLLMIGFGTILYRNKRYKRYLLLQFLQKFEDLDVKPTIFAYNELRTATRDFHPDMKLGQGSFGAVYKGVLANKSIVAIKQLIAQSTQSSDDFLNEIVLITGMRHRNLVNLKGCCLREHQKILVYEYVDNYDIDQILLNWPSRLKICLGVARGLHYLHALAQPRIIHRDIKASNVLLDKNFEAKIADFGLALLFPDNESHIMTIHVAGTKGYLAPEYVLHGQLSDKVDVFSFGMLCLEVVSGRRNIDEKLPVDEIYLSKWAWKLHGVGNLMQLVDSTLILQDDQKLEVIRLINIALLCVQRNEEQRPTMARVVALLQGDTDSEVVMVNDESKDQYKDDASLLQAFGRIGLDSINEEFESWIGTSSRWEVDSSERNSTLINPMIELGCMRHK